MHHQSRRKKLHQGTQQGGRMHGAAGPCTDTGEGHLGQAWAPCALTRMTAGLTLKPMGSAWAPRTAMLMICGTMLTPGTCTRVSEGAGRRVRKRLGCKAPRGAGLLRAGRHSCWKQVIAGARSMHDREKTHPQRSRPRRRRPG